MKKESLILGKILKRIAPKIGAKVFLEPEWKVTGQIVFKNGNKSYFRYNTVDLNPVGSSDIAKDKDYANFFMKSMGYKIIPGSKTFFSKEWANALNKKNRSIYNAYKYANKLGFPVVVKPNSGSQGSGVSIVYNKKEFYESLNLIFQKERVALVQKVVKGKDYRIVVLDNKIISAYERKPLSILGDGKSTILTLLKNKQKDFIASSRDTQIKLNDPRIKNKLKRQKMSFYSIPQKGQQIYLLDNANLSTGGDSLDVTHNINPFFKKIAIKLTKDMGLRFCGVDIMIDGDISKNTKKYWIIEINAAPGLDHYSKTGNKQQKIVEDLYLQVLKSIER